MSLPTTFFIGKGAGVALPFNIFEFSNSYSPSITPTFYRGWLEHPNDSTKVLAPSGQSGDVPWFEYSMNADGSFASRNSNAVFTLSFTNQGGSGGHRAAIPFRDGSGMLGTTWSQSALRRYQFPSNPFSYSGNPTIQQVGTLNYSIGGSNGSWGMATKYDAARDRVYFARQGVNDSIGIVNNFSTMSATSNGSATVSLQQITGMGNLENYGVEYDPLTDTMILNSADAVALVDVSTWSQIGQQATSVGFWNEIGIWGNYAYLINGATVRIATRS